MKRMKRLILVLTLSSSVSCTTVEYVPVPLDLPAKPVVPSITNKELKCVNQETYNTLVQRDLAYNFYIGRLEAVIKSTWNKEDDVRRETRTIYETAPKITR